MVPLRSNRAVTANICWGGAREPLNRVAARKHASRSFLSSLVCYARYSWRWKVPLAARVHCSVRRVVLPPGAVSGGTVGGIVFSEGRQGSSRTGSSLSDHLPLAVAQNAISSERCQDVSSRHGQSAQGDTAAKHAPAISYSLLGSIVFTAFNGVERRSAHVDGGKHCAAEATQHPVQIRAESALRCKYCHGRLKLASEQHRHWSVPRRHWSRPESNPLSTARRVLTERLSTVPGAPGTSRPKNYWVARRMAVKSRQQGRASSRASSRGPPTLSREAQNLHEVDGKSAAEATRPSGTGLPPSGTPQVSWCCRSGLRVRTCLLCGEVPELVGKALLTKERSSHSTHRTASHLPGAYKLSASRLATTTTPNDATLDPTSYTRIQGHRTPCRSADEALSPDGDTPILPLSSPSLNPGRHKTLPANSADRRTYEQSRQFLSTEAEFRATTAVANLCRSGGTASESSWAAEKLGMHVEVTPPGPNAILGLPSYRERPATSG
ncbi:hypothetical protein VFPFJ_09123 [Purpureocillium lilacinum]|uniref:Uncharacterized protein n=1 Tax=Purpureocillium lilacinum TaxID=33203 RepID=A0A179H191_PURLI|nr:hypothetical protein VFPFJ_09123 [Purpureocillium lilacinum]OAQ83320.1 hypothetical protein VFPFJ_09123 [Purpureocillium lilacinum]